MEYYCLVCVAVKFYTLKVTIRTIKNVIAIFTGYQFIWTTSVNFLTFNIAVIIEEPLSVLDIHDNKTIRNHDWLKNVVMPCYICITIDIV